MNSMIQVREDLERKRGDTVVFPTVRLLAGAGVTGDAILEGNEEVLNARSLRLSVGVIRHAVAVTDWDEQKSVIDLRNAARDMLMNWAMMKMRADLITALGSITADSSVSYSYAAATAAQRNYWMTNNADRVLFGSTIGNASSNVMATALATLTVASSIMQTSIVSLAKRIAKTASPHIRPIRVNNQNDEEWFVCFMPSLVYRDFRKDATFIAAEQYAMNRGADNPLFTAGDLIWDGVIIREIPELPVIAGAGAAGINVAASYLCGAQALGVAYAQRTKSTTNTRDYNFMHGVGLQEIRGIGKLRFGTDPTTDDVAPKDHGMVTIFTPATADA